jgi:hypothetical protein
MLCAKNLGKLADILSVVHKYRLPPDRFQEADVLGWRFVPT